MKLFYNVLVLPMHPAARAAKQIATLDLLSQGRVVLGVGVGARQDDYAAVGAAWPGRLATLERQVQEIRRLWAGELASGANDPIEPMPVQPGGPPLWIAATSRAGAERAARFDTHLLPQGPRHAVLDPWQAQLTATNRRPEDYRVGIIRGVFVTDDAEREWAPIAVAEKYRRDVYVGLIKASGDHGPRTDGPRPAVPLNPLQWTVGDVEHCVAELTEFMREHRVTDLVTWGAPPGMAPSVMNASLERFARNVVPRVRAAVEGGELSKPAPRITVES